MVNTDLFLSNSQSEKMGLLKSASLKIKAQTNLEHPVESLIFDSKNMSSSDLEAPQSLFKFKQLITTPTTTYRLDIELKYEMDLAFSSRLSEFRSVDI